MFLDQIDTGLFRPLSSPNAMVYGISLWALYNRLVINQLDSNESTPKECRDAIHYALLENNQRIDWLKEELISPPEASDENDDAARIYRYLRQCGWVKEMDEVGYRRITYMPRIAASLLSALDDISKAKPRNVGATCQGVYLSLRQAKENPAENASAVRFAADTARAYCSDLNNIAGSSREIAHQIIEENTTAEILAAFFNKFIKGILLADYSKLKTTNHPYRYRGETISLAVEILYDTQLMDSLASSLRRQEDNEIALDEAKARLQTDLEDIYRCFQRVDDLMQRIDHYRQLMTKRSREAMQYAMTATPNLGNRIDKLISELKDPGYNHHKLPALVTSDSTLGPARLYVPKAKQAEAKPVAISRPPPPIEQIAISRAMDAYYGRRAENPQRIMDLLEVNLGSSQYITTDDINLTGLDEFLGYIQLRDLLHDAVPPSSAYRRLLHYYKVTSMPGESTSNQYLKAPKLRIERRRQPPIKGVKSSVT